MSVDLYVEKTAARAKLVVVRMMGGAGYWPYGLDRLRALARGGGPRLIVVPGDDRWDEGLEAFTTEPPETSRRLWRYLVEGGAGQRGAGACLHGPPDRRGERAGRRRRRCRDSAATGRGGGDVAGSGGRRAAAWRSRWRRSSSTARSSRVAPPRRSMRSPRRWARRASRRCRCSWRASRTTTAATSCRRRFEAAPPAIVLNTTAFAVSAIGASHRGTVLDAPGRPVLQVILGRIERGGVAGEPARTAAARPDHERRPPRGRRAHRHPRSIVQGRSLRRGDRQPGLDLRAGRGPGAVRRGAGGGMGETRRKPAQERRVAIVLSNYPNRESRVGNAVGLDTAASAIRIARSDEVSRLSSGRFPWRRVRPDRFFDGWRIRQHSSTVTPAKAGGHRRRRGRDSQVSDGFRLSPE